MNANRELPSEQPAVIPAPRELSQRVPLSSTARAQIARTRQQIAERLRTAQGRHVVVVGPCSVHSEEAARAYAARLLPLAKRLEDEVLVVMRAYFEKPRTTVGWKGFLYDPDLDGSDDLAQGLRRTRALMVELAEMGLPIATELLEPLAVPYFQDCVSWTAIGARTTESQIHRQMASGLPMPVGFKNSMDGNAGAAVAAMRAAASPHAHLGVGADGGITVHRTAGNSATHLVLRGGLNGPNYDARSITQLAKELSARDTKAAVMVDCAHGNSNKCPEQQPVVAGIVGEQLERDDVDIFGIMVEGHVETGRQELSKNSAAELSVTDPCLGFEETEELLEAFAAASGAARSRKLRRCKSSRAA